MKTPAINTKYIATIPVLLSTSIVAIMVWMFHWNHYVSSLILGVIAAGLVDLDSGLAGRFKNTLFALGAFAVSSLTIELSFPYPMIFPIAFTILAFAVTLIGAAGARYRTIAFGTLAVAVYATLTYDSEMAWYTNSLLILFGSLLHSLIIMLVHIIFPHRPVQENMAAAYDALAHYLEAKSAFFDPDEADFLEEPQIQLALKNTQVINTFNQCRNALFYRMRGQHRHPRTTKMLRYYFVAQDIHERISSSHVDYRAFAKQLCHSDLIFRLRHLLCLQADACRELANSLRSNGGIYEYSPRLARATKGTEQALTLYQQHSKNLSETEISLYRVQRLLDNVVHVSRQFSYLGNPDANAETLNHADEQTRIVGQEIGGLSGAWRILRKQFTFQAPVFRHAVRMAIIVLISCVLVELLKRYFPSDNPNLGYWVLLTAVFVCQPNYSATKSRLIQRIIGTVAGVLVGSLLPYFPLTVPMQLSIVVVATTLFFFFRTSKYSFSTFFITLQALMSFAVMGFHVTEFFVPRVVDTIIGSIIAGLAVYFLWADWHYLALEKTGLQAIVGQADYLKQILADLQNKRLNDNADYRLARRISHERAASLSSTVSDMSSEVKKYGQKLTDGFLLLKINYSLISYISALGSYRHRMHDYETPSERQFLSNFFAVGQQIVMLLQEIGKLPENVFQQNLHRLQKALDEIRPADADDEQSQVLWQQLFMISELLLPSYQALHRSNNQEKLPETAAI